MSRILVVDMGNKRLKWAVLEIESLQSAAKILSDLDRSSGVLDLAHTVQSISTAYHFDTLADTTNNPDQVLFSCVGARQAGKAFDKWCRKTLGIKPTQVYSEPSRFGLDNQYDDPDQLGSDRWLAAVAAYSLVSEAGNRGDDAVIVIDAGTAVTVDLVMHSAFKGGAILPGVAMAISALANSTGEIRIDVKSLTRGFLSVDDLNILATNSDDAVSAGALASVTGGIERCLELIQRVTDTGAKVLITGGDARLIASMMKSSSEVVPNLVLAGLALIAAEDTK